MLKWGSWSNEIVRLCGQVRSRVAKLFSFCIPSEGAGKRRGLLEQSKERNDLRLKRVVTVEAKKRVESCS
ncbi:hypothetical protein R1flu_018202 [Riccia fluitans]|uniref:Uncharacterized protein n=1 Tax=Riccia fluitans TaxID=41844 RepID=A0ABD1ZJ34_9MARC